MEIVKLLKVGNESTDANAVLINDQGEEYPVFLESLTNTVYLPLLLESGYKLVGLPYQFKKDGASIFDLPVEEYVPTDAELEGMHYSLGAPTPFEELKKHMSEEEVTSIPMPPTNYTIKTREEFLSYLNDIDVIDLEEDFKPINYFVSPAARFNLTEYTSEKFAHYVQIMSRRRNMSLRKFQSLLAWLRQFGLTDAADEIDVLDAYFAWGLDGLNAPIIAKRREQRPNVLNGNVHNTVPSYRRTQGFIDSYGNQLTPENEAGVRWELPSSSPNYVTDITRQIPVGDTTVQEYRCKVPTTVVVLEGPNYNVYFNQDCVVMLLHTYVSLRVQSPVAATNIQLSMAMPKNKDKLLEHCYMEALARMLYNKRRSRVDVSSYKALTICGANPKTALDYVATYDGMDKESQDSDSIVVRDYDIANFLNGDAVEDTVREYLQGIIDGTINIDSIAVAKKHEASVNINSTFNEIYAIHNVLGISLSEIYDKFSTIDDTTDVLVFSNGSSKHTMNVSKLKLSLNGYLSDIQNYDLKNAENCTAFIHVVNIAREVGNETCRKHVGIEFYMVIKRPAVNELLDELCEKYVDKVNYSVPNATERAKLEKLKYMFSLSRYFEIAINGRITWPDRLGGAVETVDTSVRQKYAAHLLRKIENLTTFCSYTIQGMTARDLSFNLYCTNAYITPEYVIPRQGYTIHEAAFYALWNNYAATNPQVYNQLIDVGALPRYFMSWSSRYEDEQFASRDMFDVTGNDSLTYYAQQATKEQNDWPRDLDFDSVQHPIEYMFPGVYKEERVQAKLEVLREGTPVVRIGTHKELTYEDMKDILYPDVLDSTDDQYIRMFRGFDAEAFNLCGDVLDKIPSGAGCEFIVDEVRESVYIPGQERSINFRQLTEVMGDFNIVHVYDRIYLFKSQDGQLWEVRI